MIDGRRCDGFRISNYVALVSLRALLTGGSAEGREFHTSTTLCFRFCSRDDTVSAATYLAKIGYSLSRVLAFLQMCDGVALCAKHKNA